MAEKNTLQKGKRVLQASPFDAWREAPRPNYTDNSDLKFPYSEYPRKYQYEYYSVRLPMQPSSSILDFWGEGRIVDNDLITGFPGAYNVNHQFQLVSNGANTGKKIPNRIPTLDYKDVSVAKYIPKNSFDIITLMGAPISEATATEIARIISGDQHSVVVIYGKSESDQDITVLKRKLDNEKMVLLPHYTLPSPLNEINLTPALAFRSIDNAITQAKAYFSNGQMSLCADILCSLQDDSNHHSKYAYMALRSFFNAGEIENSYKIFALGYELNKTSLGQQVMSACMNSNVVRIVRKNYQSLKFQSNYGSHAYLCVAESVSSGSYDWAFFGTASYIDNNTKYNGGQNLSLVPHDMSSNYDFQIQCNFGSQSYLCVNHPVPAGSSEWQWALFGTPSYLAAPTYDDGQYFRLIPINGGDEFQVQSHFGNTSYLCVNGEVNSWQWGFFGTEDYVDSHYSGGFSFTPIFK